MKWRLYWQLLRPFTLIPPALGMLSGGITALGAKPKLEIHGEWGSISLKLLAGIVIASFLNGASNTLNQIYDLDLDRINKPTRPLPSQKLSIREAWIISLFLYISSVTLAALVNIHCFLLVFAAAVCTWIYSVPPLRTKRHWLAANITIAIPRGVFLKVAGWSLIKNINNREPWYIGLIFGLFLLGATSTKDYADIEGDRAGGCNTLPIRFGVRRSIIIITPSFILPFFLIPLGAYTGVLTATPLFLYILGFVLSFWGCYVVYLILSDPYKLTTTENHPSWKQMYLMMLFAQVGFALTYIL